MAIRTGTAGVDTLTGTPTADTITGLGANDTLFGLGGNDSIDGGTGNDSMIGGTGLDTYTVNSADDVIIEVANGGIDTVRSTATTYTLGNFVDKLLLLGTGDIDGTGNNLGNVLTGNSGSNELRGLGGRDTIDGKAGADSLFGGDGNDTYLVDNAGDEVTENANEGTDRVLSSKTFVLGTNVENLTLLGSAAINGTGNSGANILTGNLGANSLSASTGDDRLLGGGGADVLVGGGGNDRLEGGSGNDTLTFDALDTGKVDGGIGNGDTLKFAGSGSSLNITVGGVSGTLYTGLERVDLTGTGNNTFTLNEASGVAFSGSSDTLKIDGNAGDVVTTTDTGWGTGTAGTDANAGYTIYTKGDVTLIVDTDVTRTGIQA